MMDRGQRSRCLSVVHNRTNGRGQSRRVTERGVGGGGGDDTAGGP